MCHAMCYCSGMSPQWLQTNYCISVHSHQYWKHLYPGSTDKQTQIHVSFKNKICIFVNLCNSKLWYKNHTCSLHYKMRFMTSQLQLLHHQFRFWWIRVRYTEQLSATPRKSSKLIEIIPAWSLSRARKASEIKHKDETHFKIHYKN